MLLNVRFLAISALLLTFTSLAAAQNTSRSAAMSMSATVLPSLKLLPQAFAVEGRAVSARIIAQGTDTFLVLARVTGGGRGVLQIPVQLSSNVKSFIVSASSTAAVGSVRMVTSATDRINVLSHSKPLQSSSVFALGLPAPGRLSAAGTLNGTIEISLAELPAGVTKEISIRLNIAGHSSAQ